MADEDVVGGAFYFCELAVFHVLSKLLDAGAGYWGLFFFPPDGEFGGCFGVEGSAVAGVPGRENHPVSRSGCHPFFVRRGVAVGRSLGPFCVFPVFFSVFRGLPLSA